MLREAGYFNVGDKILYGKWKNHHGRIVALALDAKGNPTVEIEPIPKGRKQNKIFGLFRIWHAKPVEKLAERVATRYRYTLRA